MDEEKLKLSRRNYLIATLVLSVLGLLLIVFRNIVVGLLAGVIPGIILILIGIVEIILFIKTRANVSEIIIGVLAIAAGIVLLCNRMLIVTVLAVLIGLYLLIEGAMKMATAFKAKKSGISNWFVLLIIAIIAFGLGIFLVVKPFVLGSLLSNGFVMIIGIMLVIAGLLNLLHVVYTSKMIRSEKKNVVDMDEYVKKNGKK